MRKVIALFLASIFLVSSSISVLADKIQIGPNQPETIEEAVTLANIEIGYEYFEQDKVHKDVWKEYLSLVYGSPHGDKKGEEYRYLGYTPENEPFTNIAFPHDAWAGGYLDDRDWIETPWNEGYAINNLFNNNPDYEISIELGLAMFYGSAFKWEKEDWYKYVQVMQPPTDYTFGMGRMWHRTVTGIWYVTIPMVPLLYEEEQLPPEAPTPIQFTVNHYEEGTENEVYRSEYVTNSETPQQVYAKSGIGLDGNEWICTTTSPQTVEIIDGGEYNFYYTKKPKPPVAGEGQLILVKDPLVTANCKMPGRKNVPDTRGGTYPDGLPLFRGDQFRPTGTIKNPNGREVFVEYSMTLKDKPDKNFRQVDYKAGEGVIEAGGTKVDNFSRTINSSDRYGNVYVLTVEARQRIIVPVPPPKPGPKPERPTRPDRDDYDSTSDYRRARDEYRRDLENYYEELEEWYERKEAWDSYVSTWGDPDTGEVHKYKGHWVSEKYGWRTGKGEDMNYVMLNIKQNIEDMDGGLKDSAITE